MSNQQIMVQSQDIIEQMQYSNKINREKFGIVFYEKTEEES